jgi:hypothetical protein
MPNKRFLDLARRQRNEELPKEKSEERSVTKSSSYQGKFHARFLDGDFGEESFEKYQELVSSRYSGIEGLDVLEFDGVIKGSSPPSVIVMNEVLREQGYSVATPADVDRIVRDEILDLRNQYEDMALVLFNEDNPNEYLAESIGRQSKDRGFTYDPETPLMIPLQGLELFVDNNSPVGFAFSLPRDARLFPAPQLSNENDKKRFSKSDGDGLPIFEKNGSYQSYTTDSGLRVLIRDGNLSLDAWYDDLSSSCSVGRVLAVRGEATTPKTGGKK